MKRVLSATIIISLLFLTGTVLTGCQQTDKEKDTDSGNPSKELVGQNAEETGTTQAPAAVAKSQKPITIAMVGDIMMGTTVPKGNLPANDGKDLFKDVADILRNADIAAGNLEGSLYDGEGKPKPGLGSTGVYHFKMPEHYINNLLDAGFDFVTIANNHINDFGPDAFENTQKVLKQNNLAYAGVSGTQPTTIVEKDGRKIGFAAFGFDKGMPSVNNFEEIKTLVSGLKKDCDFVVVTFHGGGEGKNFQHVPHKKEITSKDRGDVEKFAHAAIDAGADAVYGHSPHVPRAAELYKDRIIFYSLGNFCTPYRFNLEGVNGLSPLAVVTLNPDGTFASGKIHSFRQSRGVGPRKDSSNSAAKKIRELTKSDFPSTPLQISDNGEITVSR